MRTTSRSVALLAGLAVLGCSSHPRVMVPPRLELAPLGRVGLVVFTMEDAEGSLDEFATSRFMEETLAAQTGMEILELGYHDSLLAELGRDRMDRDALAAIGERYGLGAVFLGELEASDVKPKASLRVPPRLSAEVSVRMVVRLLSAESGGTLWTRSARATDTVAELALTGGIPRFGAEDPEDAYGELVDVLVYEVTHDLRPTWARAR